MGVGMPAHLKLELFGGVVCDTFGHLPYLVGSAQALKQGWRDVDVRLILPDDEYEALFADAFGTTRGTDRKWAALCMAFSALGREMTGLPIDFQIQQQTHANAAHDKPRDCLGIRYLRRTLK